MCRVWRYARPKASHPWEPSAKRITRACVQHKHLVHKRVGVHQRSLALGILVGLSKETRQMEVLEYVAQVNDIQPQSLAVAVNEALQEEEEVPGAERWPRSSCW